MINIVQFPIDSNHQIKNIYISIDSPPPPLIDPRFLKRNSMPIPIKVIPYKRKKYKKRIESQKEYCIDPICMEN
tara:strand:+ start:4831 stop:5052 length:222 start_codon:yes stop_codon:yes gene_type:complete